MTEAARPRPGPPVWLFSLALLQSALLLFWLELALGKLVLPAFGGSASVWNSCLFLYQGCLLLGYGWAHLLSRFVPLRLQLVLQLGLFVLVWLTLPVKLPAAASGAGLLEPLLVLAAGAGLPLFAVSTVAPLLQHWFAGSGHGERRDPYFLYAASNAGSFLALLLYPLLLEPRLSQGAAEQLWRAAFGALGLLVAGAAVLAARGARAATPAAEEEAAAAATDGRSRAAWVLLAFVPSSLLHGVTTVLTTDLAATPLLWAIPLALYLASYVAAFARWQPLPALGIGRVLPLPIGALILLGGGTTGLPGWLLLGLHLAGFFLVAFVLHRALAERRPAPARLTEFYLLVAVGGGLGGLFNALLAPLLFSTPREYALILVVAALLGDAFVAGRRGRQPLQLALGLLVVSLLSGLRSAELLPQLPGQLLVAAMIGAAAFALRLRRGPVIAALVMVPLVGLSGTGPREGELLTERSFHGVHRIVHDPALGANEYYNGTTLHGRQLLDPARRLVPSTYYHPAGPVGEVMRGFSPAGAEARIGAVGLGVGSILSYGQPGQRWTFYELDDAVERVARNGSYFTFLSEPKASFDVVLGDGRLSLASTELRFGLLVLDSFSSDAIPVHLLTREAFGIYRDRLAEGGYLLVHLTNRYLDLEPVLGAVARDTGLVGLVREDLDVSPELLREGKTPSRWLVLADSPERLAALRLPEGWRPLPRFDGRAAWSDDHSSLLEVLVTP